jgi:hypothetical protein
VLLAASYGICGLDTDYYYCSYYNNTLQFHLEGECTLLSESRIDASS